MRTTQLIMRQIGSDYLCSGVQKYTITQLIRLKHKEAVYEVTCLGPSSDHIVVETFAGRWPSELENVIALLELKMNETCSGRCVSCEHGNECPGV